MTVAALPVPLDHAGEFGVIETDVAGRICRFEEKPDRPRAIPGDPRRALVSMGIYVFEAGALEWALRLDARDLTSRHDIGGDIVPRLVAIGASFVYDFAADLLPGQTERERGYWSDVGTIDAYYRASMDLVAPDPPFRIDNARWPIYYGYPDTGAPTGSPPDAQQWQPVDSSARIDDGATVRRSIVSSGVRIAPGALVEDSVLFDGVEVGRSAVVRGAILGDGVSVPDHVEVGRGEIPGGTISRGGVRLLTVGDRLAERAGEGARASAWTNRRRVTDDRCWLRAPTEPAWGIPGR